jgi:hypothetical protein
MRCRLYSLKPPAIYFQSVQGASASESGVRNLPLILSMSKFFHATVDPRFLTIHNSSFYYLFWWSAHCIRPLRSILDTWSSCYFRWWWTPVHFRHWISIISLDRLSGACWNRTWYLFPDSDYGWTSTCTSRGRRHSYSNSHV